jgi:hypothetical protein
MDTSTKQQVEWGVYCKNFIIIGLTADAGDHFKNRATIPLAPCIHTVKGADNMWSQNSMRTCTVAILVTPNWNSASVETGGTNQYRAHCIHLSLAVPIRRKFRFWFKNSCCRRSQTIFNWCRRNEWEATFSSVCFSWSWRSYFTYGS